MFPIFYILYYRNFETSDVANIQKALLSKIKILRYFDNSITLSIFFYRVQRAFNEIIYLGIPRAVRLQMLATGYTESIMILLVL